MLSPINDNINPNNPIVKKLKNGSCGSGGSNINIAFTLGISNIANNTLIVNPHVTNITNPQKILFVVLTTSNLT
jgi:hypothetical protein